MNRHSDMDSNSEMNRHSDMDSNSDMNRHSDMDSNSDMNRHSDMDSNSEKPNFVIKNTFGLKTTCVKQYSAVQYFFCTGMRDLGLSFVC